MLKLVKYSAILGRLNKIDEGQENEAGKETRFKD